jgi:hypothetical protein
MMLMACDKPERSRRGTVVLPRMLAPSPIPPSGLPDKGLPIFQGSDFLLMGRLIVGVVQTFIIA